MQHRLEREQSAIREEHGHLKNNLADLMGDNQNTAVKFYLIHQKEKTAPNCLRHSITLCIEEPTKKDPDKEEEQLLPDEVVSKQMSNREGQSDGNLESGRHCWIDERNKSVKSAFDTTIKMKYTNGEGHSTTEIPQ